MSIANRLTASTNPAKKFIKFKSGESSFVFYDKEKEENIKIHTPFEFIVIDEYSTVSGYHEPSNSGIYSNEVKNTKTSPINVRAFKGVDIARGIYKEIKDKIAAAGGKYAKSLYILYEGELCNLQLSGAGFSGAKDKDGVSHGGWMDKKVITDYNKVKFENCIEGKKGSNVYSVPVFENGEPFTSEELDLATEKLGELNEYMKKYLAKTSGEEIQEDVSELAEDAEEVFTVTNNAKDVPAVEYESEIKPQDLPF